MSLYTHISLFLFVLKIFVFKRIVRPMGVIQVGFSFLDEFSWISKYLLYFIKLNILQLLIVIEVYSWYVSLLCQTLEGRSQISNWISDTLTYCPPCPNCDKFYTSRCSDSGSSGACALSLTKLCSLCLSTSPGLDWDQIEIQNIEVFMNFLSQDIARTHIQITWGMGNRWKLLDA